MKSAFSREPAALQKDLAVGLHLFAGLDDILHDACRFHALVKFDNHFLGHKVDGGRTNAGTLAGCVLHQVGAVRAVHFDFIRLFHPQGSSLTGFQYYD